MRKERPNNDNENEIIFSIKILSILKGLIFTLVSIQKGLMFYQLLQKCK